MSFVDQFDRADGAVGNAWTGATWAIVSGAVANTPTLGAEMFTNPGAEGVYVAGVAPDWTKAGLDGTWSEESVIVHGGSSAQKFVGNVTAAVGTYPNTVTITNGLWYVFDGWARNDGPGDAELRPSSFRISWSNPRIPANSAWSRYVMLGYATSTGAFSVKLVQVGVIAQTLYADDFSLKLVTFASLFLLREYTGADFCVSAVVNGTVGAAGVVASCDSLVNPQSFVMLYMNGGGRLFFSKFVAGVETVLDTQTLYAITAPFHGGRVDGEILELRKVGTTYQAFYCGKQVGSDRTVADAEIVGNTYVGLMATEGVTFSDFYVRETYGAAAEVPTFADYCTPAYTPGQAIVTLRFDDGNDADYTYVRGELNTRGMAGSFAIVRSLLDQETNKVTLAELLAMQADGHEIACHSYSHVTNPGSEAEFQYESSVAAEDMRRLGFTVWAWVQPGSWSDAPGDDPYYFDNLGALAWPAYAHLLSYFHEFQAYMYTWNGASPQLWTLPRLLAHRYGAGNSVMTALGQTYAAYKALLDTAIANRQAVRWLFHSYYWDVVGAAVNIASSTNAAPIEVTTGAAHGLISGDAVLVAGHLVNTAANGTWGVTVSDGTHFTLDGSTGNGIGGATGTVAEYTQIPTVMFEQVLDYLEARVTAGEAVVMTATDQLFAWPRPLRVSGSDAYASRGIGTDARAGSVAGSDL